MSLENLFDAASSAGLLQEQDPLNAQQIIFWRKIQSLLWQRISKDGQAGVINDGEVTWTQAFVAEYEQVQRSFWQRMRQTEVEGAISGPEGKEFKSRGKKIPAYLMWGRYPQNDINDQAVQRLTPDARLEMLGSSLALIRDGIPQKIHRTDSTLHGLTNPVLSVEATHSSLQVGIDAIFEKMLSRNTPSVQRDDEGLYELQKFWRRDVGFASLDGDAIRSLETRGFPKSWIVIIPPSHRFMTELQHTFSVDTQHDLTLLYVKPVAFTPQFHGLAGVHEIRHLHDLATGKEPKHPSREEYLDGELRAFSGEIEGADLVFRGEFLRVIRQIVMHRHLTIDHLMHMHRFDDAARDNLIATIETHLKLPRPASVSEWQLRGGLYFMACGFVAGENKGSDATKIVSQKRNAIERFYIDEGVLPPDTPRPPDKG